MHPIRQFAARQGRRIVALSGLGFLAIAVVTPVQASDPPVSSDVAGAPIKGWTPEDMIAARAQCAATLRGVEFVAVPIDPVRDGECGTAAPYELVSIGRKPEVVFSPPVTVTCEMIAALARWTRDDVQPAARKFLGAPVIRIETMSSYSCRNAYGRARTRMSEHGRANAIDIRGFQTSGNVISEVLGDWGMTAREVRAQVAAVKAAADKAETARASAATAIAKLKPTVAPETGRSPRPDEPAVAAVRHPQGPAVAQGSTDGRGVRPGIAIGMPGATVEFPNGGSSGTALGISNIMGGNPSHLGGPKPDQTGNSATTATGKPALNGSADSRTQFVRAIHAAACRHFGTVLGPEANNAHRNHFHLDMAPRAKTNFCE